MTREEKFDRIISFIEAENSGKYQIQKHYNCDEQDVWFNVYVSDCSLFDLSGENENLQFRLVPLEEKIPQFSDRELSFISDALRWIKRHDLETTVSNHPCGLDDIIQKISGRHFSHEGQSTELIEVLKGMKSGKDYEYNSLSTGWTKITDEGYNLYHMAHDAKTGDIRMVE